MPAIGVGTTDSGKTLVQVSASQVFLDDFIHHRPKEPVLFLSMLIIVGLECFMVVVQDLETARTQRGNLPGGLKRSSIPFGSFSSRKVLRPQTIMPNACSVSLCSGVNDPRVPPARRGTVAWRESFRSCRPAACSPGIFSTLSSWLLALTLDATARISLVSNDPNHGTL